MAAALVEEEVEFDSNEITEQVLKVISDLENNNVVLVGLKNLRSNDKLELVSEKCVELQEEYDKRDAELQPQEGKDKFRELKKNLEHEYAERIMNYLQNEMNVVFNRVEKDGRGKELAGVLFWYLWVGEPDPCTQNIIKRILWYAPCLIKYNWYESLGYFFFDEPIAIHFFQILSSLPAGTLAALFKNNPQIFFTKESYVLLFKLKPHIPSFKTFNQVIINACDESGRTHMFYTKTYLLYDTIFADSIADLYALLSVQDVNGQTAVHVNTAHVQDILIHTYKPKHRQELINLVSITDNNGQTALDIYDGWDPKFSWLVEQVKKNRYLLYTGPTIVLIIYTTHNRDKAEEEALSIYNAFKSILAYRPRLEKNKSKDEIFELIKQAANETDANRQPKSALFVIMMSHGSVGFIEDSERKPIKLSEIEKTMCGEERLKDKPKILITQCCQQALKNIDDAPPYAPTSPHFTVIMSSIPGKKSARGVFIPLLAEQLEKRRPNDDIFKIINLVYREMSLKNHPQIPIVMGTLKAQFCPAQDWRSHRHQRQLKKVVTALSMIKHMKLDEENADEDQSKQGPTIRRIID